MSRNLILLGGGGHCESVIDAAESAGFTIMGILDMPETVGQKVLQYPIIGTDDMIPALVDKAEFIITVGQIKSCVTRIKLEGRVYNAGGRFATVIASDAWVSKHATIGEGSVVLHKAVVNANAKIGKHAIINTMADIEHDVRIGDFCHISTAAIANGEVTIGNNVFVGSSSVIHHCTTIADNVIVAAGSVVSKDLVKPGIYAGNPVKFYGK